MATSAYSALVTVVATRRHYATAKTHRRLFRHRAPAAAGIGPCALLFRLMIHIFAIITQVTPAILRIFAIEVALMTQVKVRHETPFRACRDVHISHAHYILSLSSSARARRFLFISRSLYRFSRLAGAHFAHDIFICFLAAHTLTHAIAPTIGALLRSSHRA